MESWTINRKKVVERDGKFCKVCEVQFASEVHHINPRVNGIDHSLENLVHLCRDCHLLVPSNKEEFETYRQSGGWFWEGFYLGVLSGKHFPKKDLSEIKRRVIKEIQKAKNKYKNYED